MAICIHLFGQVRIKYTRNRRDRTHPEAKSIEMMTSLVRKVFQTGIQRHIYFCLFSFKNCCNYYEIRFNISYKQ